MTKSSKICVVGTMPIDLITQVDDDFLKTHDITKQICTVISQDKQTDLQSLHEFHVIPGGSAANQAAVLAYLGNDIDFVAPYGTDKYGVLAAQALQNIGIKLVEPVPTCTTQTIFIYLTPDGSRTFAAYYDREVKPDIGMLKKSKPSYMVINGFGFHHTAYANSILNNFKKGSFSVQNMIFCPNDVSVIKECNDMCHDYLASCHHIIMNDTEGLALLGHKDALKQIETLQAMNKSGAITIGENGAYLFTPDQYIHIPTTLNPKDFVDSNGAGDAFSAGYIHGLTQGWPLEKMGLLGSYCATSVLSKTGARADKSISKSLIKIEN